MRRKFVRAFVEALDALEQGSSLEVCLSRQPALREELEPPLRAARQLMEGPHPVPRPEFRWAARERLLANARATARRAQRQQVIRRQVVPRLLYLLRPIAAGIVLAAIAGGVVGVSASSTLAETLYPARVLYPARLLVEEFQLAVASGDTERLVELRVEFADQRLKDLETEAEGRNYDRVVDLAQRYQEALEAAVAADRQSSGAARAELQQHLNRSTAVLRKAAQGAPPSVAARLDRTVAAVKKASSGAGGRAEQPSSRGGYSARGGSPASAPARASVPSEGNSSRPAGAVAAEGEDGAPRPALSSRGEARPEPGADKVSLVAWEKPREPTPDRAEPAAEPPRPSRGESDGKADRGESQARPEQPKSAAPAPASTGQPKAQPSPPKAPSSPVSAASPSDDAEGKRAAKSLTPGPRAAEAPAASAAAGKSERPARSERPTRSRHDPK